MSNVNEKNLVLTRAQSAVIARDFTTAARLYKQLLKDDPSNVDYLKEIGAIYVKAGEDEKAVPYYEQIITFYPHYIDAMNSLGAIFRRLKRYEDSINILQKAVDEGRQTASVNYNLGFTYKEMKNYDDAIDAFESVIGENPSDVLAHNHLGCIYLEKKQYQKSISAFKRGLQIDQNHPILNYNLACCYRDAKQYKDAIRYYEATLRVKPGWVDAIKDYSNLLIKCQKTQEASNLVKHSIELHPNDAKLLSILGKIYLEQFDYDSAAKMFKRASSVDGDDVAILSGLAEALEKSDKPQEALEAVCKAVEIAPDDKDVKKQYVHTLLSAEDFDSAQVNVQDLYSNDGQSDPQVLDLYGQYCICVDDEVKAGEYFDQISHVNRQYKEHLLSAASRYNQKGNYVQAERFAKDYVAKNIQNPAGYNMLGSIYTKQGNVEGAIESYNKSQNLKKPNILAEKQIAMLQNQIAKKEEENLKNQEIPESETEEVFEPNNPVENTFVPEKEEETFDFGSMGDNVPMGEALLEEENDFFDDLDKELDKEPEEDFFEDEDEPETNDEISGTDNLSEKGQPLENSDDSSEKSGNFGAENSSDYEDEMSGDYSDSKDENPYSSNKPYDFSDADDISPFQDFEKQEPKSTAEQLVPDADFSDSEDFDYEPVSSPDQSSEASEAQTPEESNSSFGDDEINPFDIAGGYDSSDNEKQNSPMWGSGTGNGGNNQDNSGLNSGAENGSGNNAEASGEMQNSSGNNSGNYDENQGLSGNNWDGSGETQNSSGNNSGNYGENSAASGNNSGSNNNSSGYEGNNDDNGSSRNDFSAKDMLNGIDSDDNFDFGQFDDTNYGSPKSNQQKVPDYPYQPQPQSQPYSDYQLQSPFAREMEQRAREAAQESARYAMDTAMEAKTIAKQLADEHKALKEKLDSLDNDYRNSRESDYESVSPSVEENTSSVADDIYVPEEKSEPVKTEINPEADTDFYDRDFGNFNEDDSFVNDIAPETEESFAFDDAIDELYENDFVSETSDDAGSEDSNEVLEHDSEFYNELPSENLENTDENGEEIPEMDSTYEAETLSPASLVSPMGNEGYEQSMVEDIEDSDQSLEETEENSEIVQDETSDENETASEIELFKKLRSLCDFVPDSERLSNNFGNMKTRIEYIISKMSGKQGLLKTAEEYVSQEVLSSIEEELNGEYNGEIDQYLLVEVLEIMKSLALSLEDQSVASTLCAKADELIDKVQAV